MKFIFAALSLFSLSFSASAETAQAAPAAVPILPIEHFFKPAEFLDVRISPDGEYLAATILTAEDNGALVVLRRSDSKITATFKLAGRTFVNWFAWANNERVLLIIAKSEGSRARPYSTGEIYGINKDGSQARLLTGGSKLSELESVRARENKPFEWVQVIDTLRDDEENVLVYVAPYLSAEGSFPRIEMMNVKSGRRKVLSRSPVRNAAFMVDDQQRVRFAWGQDAEFKNRLFYRADNEAEWQLVPDPSNSDAVQYAWAMSEDGQLAILEVEQKSGPNILVTWDPKTGERKPLMKNPNVDPLGGFYSVDEKRLLGVYFFDGLPSISLLDGKHEDVAVLRGLMQSFPGEWVQIENATDDGKQLVVSVSSDVNPGEFYLFDRDSNKVSFLLSSRKWIKPEQTAEVRPIEYKARDGQTIRGYLTVPKGSSGKNLPLILNPHGGPIGISDTWGFDREVQLLANRGYAVLQVNFRGSGNFGRSFREAGYRQWGGLMIDDQTDAVQWAIKEGIADSKRICIYGASYGGYAALMGAAREPDLYRCAVGYVGVYDMPLMYSRGDVPDSRSGENFLERTLGTGDDFLSSISPANMASKIKVPVFLAAGGEDVRAPKLHSEKMRDALTKAGNKPEWMLAKNEGHGYFRMEKTLEYYEKLLKFFDKHIGPGKTAATASK
jgi:dipeptidyl aminopeptidase/acylaminoacyl peptidase